jgi:hypothetical protein
VHLNPSALLLLLLQLLLLLLLLLLLTASPAWHDLACRHALLLPHHLRYERPFPWTSSHYQHHLSPHRLVAGLVMLPVPLSWIR